MNTDRKQWIKKMIVDFLVMAALTVILALMMMIMSGCMPMAGYYGNSGQFRQEEKSAAQSAQRLEAQYAPPRYNITIEGEGHTVSLPQGAQDAPGSIETPNRINIGAEDEVRQDSESSGSWEVTQRESLLFTGLGIILIMVVIPRIVGCVKRLALIEWHKLL